MTVHRSPPTTSSTLERQLDPKNASDAQGSFAAFAFAGQQAFIDGKAKDVPGIKVVDPLTVEVTLDNPSGALPYWLTMTMASVVPKAYGTEVGYEAFEKKPVGAGRSVQACLLRTGQVDRP